MRNDAPHIATLCAGARDSRQAARRNRSGNGFLCLLAVFLLLPRPAWAEEEERTAKAAFVFNLTKYVEWPEPSRQLTICVLGNGPMAEPLRKQLDGKTSDSRPIRVVLNPPDPQLETCNIAFITYSSPRTTARALEKAKKKGILTVGDSKSFARDGGMIGLVTAQAKIQIQINLEAVADAHLNISSRLLNLSTIVRSSHEGKN